MNSWWKRDWYESCRNSREGETPSLFYARTEGQACERKLTGLFLCGGKSWKSVRRRET